MKFLIENELEKRHRKHKKTIKPGAIGSFIHPDGGNQVAIDTFNNSVDMGNVSSACDLGEALNEDYVEDKLKRLISVQHFISPKDDIQLFTTEKGNYLVRRNGKQMMILDKKNFRESEIEDLRLNGYFRDYDKARMNESIEAEDAFEGIEKRLAEMCQEAKDHSFEFEAEFPVAQKDKFFYDLLDEYNISDYDIIESNTFTSKDGEKWYYFYGVLHPFSSMYDENGAEWGYKYESLTEDTIKQDGKWVNKGQEGTHGKFNTKKEADAQRRAIFANGYKESLQEEVEEDNMNSIKEKVIKAIQDEWKTIAYYNDLIEELKKIDDLDGINVINDINNEEHIHVGQLQSLLQTMGGDIEAIHQGNEEGDEQLTESLKEQEDKINDFIEDSRGYSDYNQIVEDVADEFDISNKEAERYVWNYMYHLGHSVENAYNESLNHKHYTRDELKKKGKDCYSVIKDLDFASISFDPKSSNIVTLYDEAGNKIRTIWWNRFSGKYGPVNEEMSNDSTTNALYALRNFKKHAQNGDELKIDINGNKGEVSKEADGWYLYYGGLVTQGSYKIIEAAVKDAVMRAEAKKSMQESFDPYSIEYWNYDKEEIDKGVDYCKNHNIDVNTLNDYDFENIVILANKYYASKPDWKYTDDEILAGLNLLYDEGAMLSNLDADGVEYYIKKANNIEECYKMTNKEIKEALNKLDMWAIDNDTTFYDLKTLYEAFVNPNSPVDQKKKDKIQKALNDPTLNRDKEKLQDYISGVLSRQEESLEETLEDEEEFNNFKSANKNHNKVFDNKKFGKYFDKNGHLIPEKAKEYWTELNKPLTEGVKRVIIPKPYDEYFEVDTINVSDDDFYDYKPGDEIDGYDCHFIAYLIPKTEEVEDIYPILTDDPKYPVCELIADRLIPVDLPEDL